MHEIIGYPKQSLQRIYKGSPNFDFYLFDMWIVVLQCSYNIHFLLQGRLDIFFVLKSWWLWFQRWQQCLLQIPLPWTATRNIAFPHFSFFTFSHIDFTAERNFSFYFHRLSPHAVAHCSAAIFWSSASLLSISNHMFTPIACIVAYFSRSTCVEICSRILI